jgi:hypothetical protein
MKNLLFVILATASILYAGFAFGQQQKVAVYVTGAEEEGLNEFMGAYLVDAIVNSSNYQAVERTSDFIKELNKEQDYQRTGAVNDNQISELGRQFGVQLVCVAKIGKMGNRQFVSARLIDVETATVKNSTKPVLFVMENIDKSCAAIAVSLITGSPVDMDKLKIEANADAGDPDTAADDDDTDEDDDDDEIESKVVNKKIKSANTNDAASGGKYATLYVYRPWVYLGAALPIHMMLNGKPMVSLSNRSKSSIKVRKEGEVFIGAGSLFLNIDIEFGKEYFIRVTPMKLELKDETEGEQEYEKIKKIKKGK